MIVESWVGYILSACTVLGTGFVGWVGSTAYKILVQVIEMRKDVSALLSDSKEHEIKLDDHEKRLIKLETKTGEGTRR